jgi:hypothetical protein
MGCVAPEPRARETAPERERREPAQGVQVYKSRVRCSSRFVEGQGGGQRSRGLVTCSKSVATERLMSRLVHDGGDVRG